jgi:predicted CoA-binding protein
MHFTKLEADEICKLLRSVNTIAIIGLSSNPEKSSFRVAQAMQACGYRIVPVNPAAQRAQAAGITVVMDRCMWRDYTQLCAA